MAASRLVLLSLLASSCSAVVNLPNLVTTGEPDFTTVVDGSTNVGAFTPFPSSHAIDLNKIFRPNLGVTNAFDRTVTYRNQPEASPASARVLNLFYNTGITGTPGTGNVIQAAHLPTHNTINLVYDATNPAPATAIDVKLEAPYLEVDPASCTLGMDCRCNPMQAATTTNQILQPYLVDPTVADTAQDADLRKTVLGAGAAGAAGARTVSINLNAFAATYFEHAPWAGQDPYMRTHRRLCIRATGGGASEWRDTGIMVAVTQACSTGSNGVAFADSAANSDCSAKVRDDLSIRGANAAMGLAGATLTQTVALRGYLGDFYTANSLLVPKTFGDGVIDGETNAMFTERHSRTVCCGANKDALAFEAPGPRTVTTPANGQRYGVCISADSTEANCCGRRPYNPKEEKCCNRLGSLVENLDTTCPCTLGSRTDNPSRAVGLTNFRAIDNVCDRNAANIAATGDFAGLSNAAVTSGTCADITKNSVDLTNVVRHSHCTGDGLVACDDGNLYDPATHQCCLINGVQTLDFPCPCSLDTHCSGNDRCCFQAWPLAVENEGTCSPFANFPIVIDGNVNTAARNTELSTGPAPTALQQCRGLCYDSTYQTCCNGNLCEREYERCCNTTCCNTFTSSCTQGMQGSGSIDANSPSARNYGVYFEVCTEIENLTGMRAFFVFVLPAVLLFATLLSLALVAVVARRATEHIFELTERALVVVAVLVVLLATAFFFSPLWKWGLVIALLGLAAIVIAVARRMDASLVLVILAVIVLLYVVNPWAGNNYIGATSNVVSNGVWSQSLFEAARNLWYDAPTSREGPAAMGVNECTNFYDYFKYDANVRDFGRMENPNVTTFGYCARNWITALMVIAAVLTFLLVVLLLLAIFSYLKKLGYKPVEPVQLEITYDQPPVAQFGQYGGAPLLANPVF